MIEKYMNIYDSHTTEGLIIKEYLNDLIIQLVFNGYKFKISTPLYDINGISPATIKLTPITSAICLIRIHSIDYNLFTIVSSFVLEVFNPDGVLIIKIVFPNNKDSLV